MGKVEKFVKEHEAERHLGTDELIGIMNWYIQEMARIDRECNSAKWNIQEAYNARLNELRRKMDENQKADAEALAE